MSQHFLTGFVITFLLPVIALLSPIATAEFRIDNTVQGVKSTAFLLDGKFYSMIGNNGEIVEFDAEKKTFTLMDPELRIQTQINAEETRKRVEMLREHILNHPNADPHSFRYFAFKPTFETEFDAASGTLVLQSNWIDYEIKTVPFTDPSAGMYHDFCDWICYLNLRLNPYSTQMLTRLEVNRLLRSGQRFAVHVSESIYINGKQGLPKPAQASSSHTFARRLGETDRKRIEQALEFKRTFPQVPFDEYQKRFAEKLAK
jgi:hypothetical protein